MAVSLPAIVAAMGQYFHTKLHAHLDTGVRVEYALHGRPSARSKLVLLCGMGMAKEAFHPLVHALTVKALDDVQILTFDNRGIGGSDTSGPYSTHIMALDALALMDHLGWQSVHVFGTSMGGMIALELASVAPSRVRSLNVAVASAGYWQGTTSLVANARCIMRLVGQMFKCGDKKFHGLLRLLYPPLALASHGQLLHEYHQSRGNNGPSSLAGAFGHQKAVVTHHVSVPRLRAMHEKKFPILVLGATQDVMLPPTHSTYLVHILAGPHTTFVEFEEAGHGLHTQCADSVADLLLAQISKSNES